MDCNQMFAGIGALGGLIMCALTMCIWFHEKKLPKKLPRRIVVTFLSAGLVGVGFLGSSGYRIECVGALLGAVILLTIVGFIVGDKPKPDEK